MQEPQMVPQRRQKRRKLTALWIVVSSLLALVLIAVGGLAWSGLVPGLSHVAGADRPRDLGVKTTPSDYDSAVQRLSAVMDKIAPAGSAAGQAPGAHYAGASGQPQQVEIDLTEGELSALLAHSNGDSMPLQNPQVRIHDGGQIEVAAGVNTTDIPLEEVPAGMLRQLVAGLPDLMPVYVRGSIYLASPTELAMDVERLELGRLPLPAAVRDALNQELVGGILDQLLDPSSGVTVQELRFEEGKVYLKVTVQQ